jgi:MoxR-like ATPase
MKDQKQEEKKIPEDSNAFVPSKDNNTPPENLIIKPKTSQEIHKMLRAARSLKKRSSVTAQDIKIMKEQRKKSKHKRYLNKKNKIKQGNLKHEMEIIKCLKK